MQDWQTFVGKPKVVRAFRTETKGSPKGISAGDEVPGLIHYEPGDWIVESDDGTRQAISDEAFKVNFSDVDDQPPVDSRVKALLADIGDLTDALVSANLEIEDLKAPREAAGDMEQPDNVEPETPDEPA